MSRQKGEVFTKPVEPKAEKPALKSDSQLMSGFRAAALCRTKNGWAVAVVSINADGQLEKLDFSTSQSFPEFVATRVKKQQMALNQEALQANPWLPGGGT